MYVYIYDSWIYSIFLIVCVCLPLVDEIDVSSTAKLYKSLAKTAPEIKECVDACNFIAESTKQQNDIGSVSVSLCVCVCVCVCVGGGGACLCGLWGHKFV